MLLIFRALVQSLKPPEPKLEPELNQVQKEDSYPICNLSFKFWFVSFYKEFGLRFAYDVSFFVIQLVPRNLPLQKMKKVKRKKRKEKKHESLEITFSLAQPPCHSLIWTDLDQTWPASSQQSALFDFYVMIYYYFLSIFLSFLTLDLWTSDPLLLWST